VVVEIQQGGRNWYDAGADPRRHEWGISPHSN
jgi:hypothetical protein